MPRDTSFTSFAGHCNGRCPLTGRFMSAQEFGDDEPLEHFFGPTTEDVESYEPDEDDMLWLAKGDEVSGDQVPEDEYYFSDDDAEDGVDYSTYGEADSEEELPTPAFGAPQRDLRVLLLGFDRNKEWRSLKPRGVNDQGKRCRKAWIKRQQREGHTIKHSAQML